MKAFRFNQWQQPGRLEDIPVPEPGHQFHRIPIVITLGPGDYFGWPCDLTDPVPTPDSPHTLNSANALRPQNPKTPRFSNQ